MNIDSCKLNLSERPLLFNADVVLTMKQPHFLKIYKVSMYLLLTCSYGFNTNDNRLDGM